MTAPNACPACGAALRPGAPWCTLCYTDLRPKPPAPEPKPSPQPEPQPKDPLTDPLTDPLPEPMPVPPAVAVDGPTWPCTTCGAVNPMERSTCASCGSGFLAGAKDDSPLLELPVVGDITRLGRGQRFALAGGVVLAFVVLTLLVGLLLG